MKSRDFCFWLQGFFELTDSDEPTPEQVRNIRKHLQLVFIHEIDPSMPNPKLDAVHNVNDILMRC